MDEKSQMSSRKPSRIPPGRIKLSIDDWPHLPNDGKRYQILDGELDVEFDDQWDPAGRYRGQLGA